MVLQYTILVERFGGNFTEEEKQIAEGCINTCCSALEDTIKNREISYNTEELDNL